MNDDELRKLLQNSLSGRRAPTEIRERIVNGLRPIRRRWIAGAVAAAAAALLTAAGAALLAPHAEATNPMILKAIEQHDQSPVFGHAPSSATPREVSQTVSEATGRDLQIPGMRDVGFTQMQAHRCESTGWAHVVYANALLKVSCFVLDAESLDLSGGSRLSVPGIDAYTFGREGLSVVAIRDSGIAKIWVGDLRSQNLASIAIDAELKRHQLQTAVLSVPESASVKHLGAVLQSTPGVEDVEMNPAKQEAYVRFDRRRVTLVEIAALLATNEIAASPRDWAR